MVMAIAAITSIAATTASAQEGLLPIGSTFTASGGAGKLESLAGSQIVCKGFTLKGGEVTSDESGKIKEINFEKCTALGFPTNSLGDKAETILVDNASVLLCLIEPKTLVFGVLIKLASAVHLEVPLAGALLKIEGSIIGTITPNAKGKEKKITFAQKAGDPTVTKCTNLLTGKVEEDKLTVDLDDNKPVSAGIDQTATVIFNQEVELMDT
jgi:hypothetical protein